MADLIDTYHESNQNSSFDLENVFDARESAVGQSFLMPASDYLLRSAKFTFRKQGNPIGNAVARLYAHTGVFGTSSKPTGPPLATSNPVPLTSFVGFPYTLKTFTFPAPYYTMVAGTHYVIAVLILDATLIDWLNKLLIGCDSTSPTHAGNSSRAWGGGSWITSSNDVPFYIYGDPAKGGASCSIVPIMKGIGMI